MDATFTDADGTTITLPLRQTGGGLTFGLDVGKPELQERSAGNLNPRFRDEYSGLQNYTINGVFDSSNAYQNARDLQDMFKSQWQDPIEFDFGLSDIYDADIVVPSIGSDSAVTVTYDPGRRDWVNVELTLSRVDEIVSGSTLKASTPTASGSGPVELQGIELEKRLSVERTIGRPNDSEQGKTNSNLPLYIYKRKKANDAFSITFEDTDTARQTVSELKDIFTRPLGSTPLSLNFNGIYGLGEFKVVPDGSQAIRITEITGEEGVAQVPQINLRRVRDS